jgi:hypothetical protein
MRVIGSTFQEFQIGETVAYNENFLDRHDRSAINMRGARGKVMALHRLDNGLQIDRTTNLGGAACEVAEPTSTPHGETATPCHPCVGIEPPMAVYFSRRVSIGLLT